MSTTNRSEIQKYNPFEIVVNTNIAGDSGVGNFELKLDPSESYRYYVDWGDGSTSASTTTTNLTHSYGVPGFYNVKVYGRFDKIYNNNSNEGDKITDVISWGNIKWRSFDSAFNGCSNLTGMTTQPPILEVMDDINGFENLFIGTDFDSDLGSWDISKIFTMKRMFRNSTSFNNGGLPSISGWTTITCTNMSDMFYGTPFNQDIGSWDVSSVTNMSNMFFNDTSFNNGGSPSISGWTTSACTNMGGMFTSSFGFNQPIGSWDVSNVTTMNQMFQFAITFNQDVGSWDVSNVGNMGGMFLSASNFNQDLSLWNVSGVTDMTNMFLSSSLDNANYNAILTGWTGWVGTGATKTLQTNVSFHAGTAQYFTGTTAEAARNYLTDATTGLSWTITDGGGI